MVPFHDLDWTHDGIAADAASFAYRWALARGQTEAEAAAAAGHAYPAAGGDPVRASGRVREIVASEADKRPLWFKRPLRARVVTPV